VRLTVFKYCFGMIMSVSTLIIFIGAATPSSLSNLSIVRSSIRLIHRSSEGMGQDSPAHGYRPRTTSVPAKRSAQGRSRRRTIRIKLIAIAAPIRPASAKTVQ